MDVVYGLSGSASSERNSPKVPSNRPANVGPANFWRIWLSPNSPFAIAIDRASGSVVAIAREVDADDLTAKLEPPSQARHLEIAREFVQGIEGEAANELTAILDNGGDDWWQPWFRKVQSIGAGERWHRHRTFAFEAVLKDSLQSLGLTTPIFDRVFATISKDRFARRPAVHTGSPAIDRELSDRGALLRVVAAAVQQMSVSDLRDLKLPVGIVLDVIHRDRI